MSIDRIHETVLQLLIAEPGASSFKSHLDIGAGHGGLVAKVRERLHIESCVCDYTDELMKLPGQRVDIANLNHEQLPYPDGIFDIVTATEVIEHLENFRRVAHEIYRVLKPGGICILSTPNILNLNSRLRFLSFGFWNLFGPMPLNHSKLFSTGGHINPISWYYVAHGLMDAGFTKVTPHIDRRQRSAVPMLIMLLPLIKLLGAWAMRQERCRYRTLDESNEPLVRAMNTIDMLLGRTLIAKALKKT